MTEQEIRVCAIQQAPVLPLSHSGELMELARVIAAYVRCASEVNSNEGSESR